MEIEDIHKSYHINSFDEGEIITRVFPASKKVKEYNDNLMIEIEVETKADHSYLGDRMEFLGIYNRMICVRRDFLGEKTVTKLHYDQWQDGWQIYNIPDFEN